MIMKSPAVYYMSSVHIISWPRAIHLMYNMTAYDVHQ